MSLGVERARVGVKGGSSPGRQQEYAVERGRGDRARSWRNVVVVSVGDGMERLNYQVLERGERRTGADNSLRLPVHSAGQPGGKFLRTVIDAALGKGAE